MEGAQFAACLFHCVSKKRPPIENQNNQNSIRTGSFLLSVCCSFFVVSTFPSVACFRCRQPSLRRCSDMARMELLDVGIGKSGEIGEDECTSAQFRTPFIQGHGQYPFHLFTGDILVLGCGFLFIFDILHRIGAQDLVVHGKIQQAVQSAEAAVGLRGAEILVPDKECLVILAKVFRYFFKGDVLLPQ